jgi:dTDP-4-amino-4,6-dideoxygalactose transaminase
MAAQVPFLDVGAAYRELAPEIDAAVADGLASGWYVLGEGVAAFERAFAGYCGAGGCLGVANGLDALRLILQALGIGPGDEVVVPSHTFVATWLAVSQVGAVPVPAEVDPATCLLDPDAAAAAIGPRTRAILPVHLYGSVADLAALGALAARHGLALVEDAAQAHGARRDGHRVGASGIAAWSFYPGKNLGALGDGGAVTSGDAALMERVAMLRNYGSREKYVHAALGLNSRLDELQARILSVKLAHLDAWNDRRRAIAARYLEALAHLDGLRPLAIPPGVEPVWHIFPVFTARRDALQRHLAARGVQSLIHYPIPPHAQACYAGIGHAPGSLPVAERLAREQLSLPIGPQMTAGQVDAVIDALTSFPLD